MPGPQAPMLDARDREVLLNRARGAVARRLGIRTTPETREVPRKGPGMFVTLRSAGALRGCRGVLMGFEDLHTAAETLADMSAFDDPRFEPVTADEWKDLQFEVSVLGPPRDVHHPSELRPGVDGVLLTADGHRGFLLPQVMDRLDGDVDAFMDALCDKAGLPPGAWRLPGARLQAYPVEHFQ